MSIFKKNYFLIIENIKDLNLKKIKKRNKFIIIYRNKGKKENISELLGSESSVKCKIFYLRSQ